MQLDLAELYQRYCDAASKANDEESDWAWIYGKHLSVIKRLKLKPELREKVWSNSEEMVQYINNAKQSPAHHNHLFMLRKLVKQSNKKISTRSRGSLRLQPQSPVEIYSNSDDICTKFLVVLSCVYSSLKSESDDDDDPFLFKPNKIAGIMSIAYSEIFDTKQKNQIKKYLVSKKIAANTGGGEFVLLAKWRNFLLNLEIDTVDKKKINVALNKKKKKSKTKKKSTTTTLSTTTSTLAATKNEEYDIELIVTSPFTPNDWRILFETAPNLYIERKKIIDLRCLQISTNKYGADIRTCKDDGNCFLDANFKHHHGIVSIFTEENKKIFLFQEREELMKFIEENSDKFPGQNIAYITGPTFKADHRLLEEPHFVALGLKEEMSIVMFKYNEKFNDNDIHIWHNKNYTEPTLYLQFSEAPTGHINYVEMGLNDDWTNRFQIPSDDTYQFIPAKPNGTFNELKIFDKMHNISSILTTDNKIITDVFGQHAKQMTTTFTQSVLIEIIKKHNLNQRNFKNKSSQEVGMLIGGYL